MSSSRRQRSRAAHLRHYTSQPGYHVPTPFPTSTTYIFTVSSSRKPLRQIISSPRALGAELDAASATAQHGGGTEPAERKVVIIKGRDERMVEAAGVERWFIDGDSGYRGKKGVWWEDVKGQVGLWTGSRAVVILLEDVRTGTSPPGGRQSSLAKHTSTSVGADRKWDFKTLEEKLAENMDTTADVPHALSEVVFERWVEYLLTDGLWLRGAERIEVLRSLERNAENARTQATGRVSYRHWTDLISRTTLRLLLTSSSPPTSNYSTDQAPEEDENEKPRKTANERSLDRVTYLGGLLLPLTVVSSILAIEGDYGPEGNNFWVFWVASALASAVAVGIIYIDQMRRMDVWTPDLGSMGGVGVDGILGVEEVRKWKRGELGWKGAMRRVCGLERWWPSEGVRFKRPS